MFYAKPLRHSRSAGFGQTVAMDFLVDMFGAESAGGVPLSGYSSSIDLCWPILFRASLSNQAAAYLANVSCFRGRRPGILLKEASAFRSEKPELPAD